MEAVKEEENDDDDDDDDEEEGYEVLDCRTPGCKKRHSHNGLCTKDETIDQGCKRSRSTVRRFEAGAAPPASLLHAAVAAQNILPSDVSSKAHSGPGKSTPSNSRHRFQALIKPTKARPEVQQQEAVEVVEDDDDSQPRAASELRVAGTVEGQEQGELVTEAEGLQLHMSGYNATGYKHVFPNPREQSNFRAFLKEQGRTVVLGNDFASPVDAAVAVARHLQQQANTSLQGEVAMEEEEEDNDRVEEEEDDGVEEEEEEKEVEDEEEEGEEEVEEEEEKEQATVKRKRRPSTSAMQQPEQRRQQREEVQKESDESGSEEEVEGEDEDEGENREEEEEDDELLRNELKETGLVLERSTTAKSCFVGVEYRGKSFKKRLQWQAMAYEQGWRNPRTRLGNFDTRSGAALAVAKFKHHGRAGDQGSDAWREASVREYHRKKLGVQRTEMAAAEQASSPESLDLPNRQFAAGDEMAERDEPSPPAEPLTSPEAEAADKTSVASGASDLIAAMFV